MGGADEKADAATDTSALSRERLERLERAAALGKLAGVIAHEIRNPLGFVANFGALSRDLVDELGEWLAGAGLDDDARGEAAEIVALLRENLDRIGEHARRAEHVVDETLRSAREQQGEAETFDANALVERGLAWARQSSSASEGVEVVLDLDPATGEARGWPGELVRVFVNLLDNAFDAVAARRAATADGEPYAPRVSVATSGDERAVTLVFEDNGIGIDADDRASVFEPFYTRKSVDEGTGLGLALSRDIVVDRHGGEIRLESEKGTFTRLTIVIPRRVDGE